MVFNTVKLKNFKWISQLTKPFSESKYKTGLFKQVECFFEDAVAVAVYLITELLGCHISFFLCLYIVFFTKYWWFILLYCAWAYGYDLNTCENGGRMCEWIKNLPIWDYSRRYFPVSIHKIQGVELDPKKNYLFCCFPHGFINAGPPIGFCPNSSGFPKLFPNHKPYIIALRSLISFPFHRDLLMGLGLVSSSSKSINCILSKPEGGQIAALIVGGAQEVLYVKPGTYTFNLKQRKGFVRLALRNGAPLVPVVSFGENDIFDQFDNSEGTVYRKFQEWMKRVFGFVMIIPKGRGFIQPSVIPFKRPINLVGTVTFTMVPIVFIFYGYHFGCLIFFIVFCSWKTYRNSKNSGTYAKAGG